MDHQDDWTVLLVTPHIYHRMYKEALDGDIGALLTASAVDTFFKLVDHGAMPSCCGTCASPMELPSEMSLLAVCVPKPVAHPTSRPFTLFPLCERCSEEEAGKLRMRLASLAAAAYFANHAEIEEMLEEARAAADPIGEVAGHA